jgi:hypothetical protein
MLQWRTGRSRTVACTKCMIYVCIRATGLEAEAVPARPSLFYSRRIESRNQFFTPFWSLLMRFVDKIADFDAK